MLAPEVSKIDPVDHGVHPVSKPRFPLRRLSPGAGLLRNPFIHR